MKIIARRYIPAFRRVRSADHSDFTRKEMVRSAEPTRPTTLLKIIALFSAFTCLVALAGCSSSDAQLEFHPTHTKGNVYETFPGAYISSTRDGEYDLVLIKDTLRSGPVGNKKGPLEPVTQPPLQQAVCIHIFWKPTSGAMIRESSITNAIVDWYVFGPERRQPDMLHYTGAAFVKLDSEGNLTNVIIGDGEILPAQIRGNLKDPVGAARLTGEVTAVRNDGRVREVLESIKDRISGNDRVWTEAESDTTPVDR